MAEFGEQVEKKNIVEDERYMQKQMAQNQDTKGPYSKQQVYVTTDNVKMVDQSKK